MSDMLIIDTNLKKKEKGRKKPHKKQISHNSG
jgi:hypothetical protein